MYKFFFRFRFILILWLMGVGLEEAPGAAYEWTWVKGEASPLEYPAYGNKGEPASANYPGKRQNPMSWTDLSGNFWLFGGTGYDALTQQGTLNDLWKFDRELNQWTWISGSNTVNQLGVYNTQGVYVETNCPGARKNGASWIDEEGNLWMFGGMGYGSSGAAGWLDDIWKFDPTSNQWVWVNGSSSANAAIVLGPEGVPSASITPGGREGAASWADTTGTLWLFGGGQSSYSRNDLWKYSTGSNEWTLIHGSRSAIHGPQGMFNPYFSPESRSNAASWIDAAGNLWLFGGNNNNSNARNDLWKFDITLNQWGWLKGSQQTKQSGIYGDMGIPAAANTPGARESAISWKDNADNLWLFGGNGYSSAGNPGFLNDAWRYNPTSNQWTWMKGSNTTNQASSHGQQGKYIPENTPCARARMASWTDSSGKLWVWGGEGYGIPEITVLLNDFWSFDPGLNQWAWKSGSSLISRSGVYGDQGIPSSSNRPGARIRPVSWTDSLGNLWLFGGFGFDESGVAGYLNDLWKYDPNSGHWVWIKGDKLINGVGHYGTQGVADISNMPGFRVGATAWTDSTGILWLFGGTGSTGRLNDLWKYDPTSNLWTWVKGSAIGEQKGVYGIRGIPDVLNTPGSRDDAVKWSDDFGNLWLLGGYGKGSGFEDAFLNDLWKYNIETNQWTWVNGSNVVDQHGNYGVRGIPDPTNCPGSRYLASGWKGQSGNFWLFGGNGFGATGPRNLLNDLWKYNPDANEWTWMHGADTIRESGIYGNQSIPSPGNTPGARQLALAQVDKTGNLWLFGGLGKGSSDLTGYLNDLWKYDTATNQWTWINGSNSLYQNGIYGSMGSPTATTTPGARSYSISWMDKLGNFWLFSGDAHSDLNSNLSDLWKFTLTQSGLAWEEAKRY